MKLPLFYNAQVSLSDHEVVLDEHASKHIVQVLRMQVGEKLQLTDGKGNLFTSEIRDDNRKRCSVSILEKSSITNHKSKIIIAISPLKNTSRFEWFLEKATEIGVAEIIPLLCERTEKQHFKWERMQGILISAMLQSQQAWLPVLQEPVKFTKYIKDLNSIASLQKMIAHCENENNKVPLTSQLVNSSIPKLILIGPEGDFSNKEIMEALQIGCVAVSLGDTRLRTETAGIVAATLMCNL